MIAQNLLHINIHILANFHSDRLNGVGEMRFHKIKHPFTYVESSATGISSKARSLRAQAQLIKTKTLTIEKRAEKTEAREQALPSTHHGNPIVE
ncbi:hypothetical protein TNCV_1644021 [Trichonephila clavipes]|nr:hypothetical protein TNCV_1644021 [Trichonephila clavipes]